MCSAKMEKNRQIVQKGLDSKKAKRKKSLIEAEQEAITEQIFNIVNAHARLATCTNGNVHNTSTWNNITYDDPKQWEEMSKMPPAYKRNIKKEFLNWLLVAAVAIGMSVTTWFILILFA